MLSIDPKDIVQELEGVPQSSVGAPIPYILADEYSIVLAYYIEDTSENWDGSTVRIVTPDSNEESTAIIRFDHAYAHIFGPPNDEAFSGHRLAKNGLEPYGAYQIKNSSWIKDLEKMNSVHPYHVKSNFLKDKIHYVFSFHDSTFECVAAGFSIEIHQESMVKTLDRMKEWLIQKK